MLQTINTPISVHLAFDHQRRIVSPISLSWEGRDYVVKKVGLHHTFRKGRVLYHVFSVQAGALFFKLLLDTETLFWRVEQISDGEVA
jgi:hypothetical protein